MGAIVARSGSCSLYSVLRRDPPDRIQSTSDVARSHVYEIFPKQLLPEAVGQDLARQPCSLCLSFCMYRSLYLHVTKVI